MGERGESGAVISGVAGLRQAVLASPWDLGATAARSDVRERAGRAGRRGRGLIGSRGRRQSGEFTCERRFGLSVASGPSYKSVVQSRDAAHLLPSSDPSLPSNYGPGYCCRWWSCGPLGRAHSPRARRERPHARQAAVSTTLSLRFLSGASAIRRGLRGSAVRGITKACCDWAFRAGHVFGGPAKCYTSRDPAAGAGVDFFDLLVSWEATPPRQRQVSTARALRHNRRPVFPTALSSSSRTPSVR